ncbi:MAG: YggS family pyridoxal phosphate-dependent enzyme [Bacteroidota bacterium]
MIGANIEKIKEQIGQNVQLVAVSKTKPVELLLEAYNAGQRVFGENKVQEMVAKHEQLPKDIEWHLIGHLQSNKVKYIATFVSLIHAVDSLKLLETINKEALKNNRVIDCLLQIYIADEETKFGLDETELNALLESETYKQMHNIRIVGLMGMATNTEDENKIRSEFRKLKSLYNKLANGNKQFAILSMGMSSDYKIAVEEGSTMVRVGSLIFGNR